MIRRSAPWLLALAGALAPASSAAQTRQECADAYVAGQVARKAGKLGEARAAFEICAASSCSLAVRRDCGPWIKEIDKERPRLSAAAVDEAGLVVAGAQISVDGKPWSDGPVDPGEHVVRAEAPGKKAAEQRITLAAGSGRREVSLRLAGSAPPPVAASRPFPVGPVVLGVLGAAGLGVFAGLGVAGNGKKAKLDELGCKPGCDPAEVRAIKTLYIGADIALGAGLAGVVAAGIAAVVHATSSPEPASTTPAVGFVPAPGGGALVVRF